MNYLLRVRNYIAPRNVQSRYFRIMMTQPSLNPWMRSIFPKFPPRRFLCIQQEAQNQQQLPLNLLYKETGGRFNVPHSVRVIHATAQLDDLGAMMEDFEEAKKSLTTQKNLKVPAELVFHPVMDAFGRRGDLKKVHELLEEFKVYKQKPKRETYNKVLEYIAGGTDLDLVLKVLMDMKNSQYNYEDTVVAKILSNFGDSHIDKLIGFFTYDSKKMGITPDYIALAYLTFYLHKKGEIERMTQVVREIQAKGNIPPSTMKQIVGHYLKPLDFQGLLDFLGEAKKMGTKLDPQSYHKILTSLAIYNSINQVVQFMSHMHKEEGLVPQKTTAQIILSNLMNTGRISDASQFMEMIQKMGVTVDHQIMDAFEKVKHLANRNLSKRVPNRDFSKQKRKSGKPPVKS